MDSEAKIADQIDGIPHPGESPSIVGHDETIRHLLAIYASGRMHHGMLFTGPRGIGKATLAMRMAAHVFKHPDVAKAPDHLEDAVTDDPVDAKIAARSHPNLLHLTRPWDDKTKKFKSQLTVDEVRKTTRFFGTSKGETGWRVAIIDAIDEMNASASNALLKILEEPPEKTLFFVLAHSKAKVMPTIRSRCQVVALRPLEDQQVLQVLDKFGSLQGLSDEDRSNLAELSKGSVRRGLTITESNGIELYRNFKELCHKASNPDWGKVHKLADSVTMKGQEDRFRLLLAFANEHLEDRATGKIQINGTPNISMLARWATVWEKTQKSTRIAEGFNLDKKQVILSLFQNMSEAAQP